LSALVTIAIVRFLKTKQRKEICIAFVVTTCLLLQHLALAFEVICFAGCSIRSNVVAQTDGARLLRKEKAALVAENTLSKKRKAQRKRRAAAVEEISGTESSTPNPKKQQLLTSSLRGGAISKHHVDKLWSRCNYAEALPFKLVESEWFKAAIKGSQQFAKQNGKAAPLYVPPPRSTVAVSFLDAESKRIDEALNPRLFPDDARQGLVQHF
jgi:hypothetical protein